jgi:hypothetical protein
LRNVRGPLLIAGESLGGIPASALAGMLPQKRRSRLLLVAPYLRHRPPEEWIENPVTARYQRRFEAVTLGLTAPKEARRFNKYMRHLYESVRPDSLVVFGSADRISRPNDLQVIGHPVQTAIEKTDHRFITAFQGTWEAVAAWLKRSGSKTTFRSSSSFGRSPSSTSRSQNYGVARPSDAPGGEVARLHDRNAAREQRVTAIGQTL